MATVDGKYKRVFGWNTVAWGKKYTEFLHAYIPSLLRFLKAEKLKGREYTMNLIEKYYGKVTFLTPPDQKKNCSDSVRN